MITLSGVSGKGTLLGTFVLPDLGTSGETFVQAQTHLDYTVPPSDWYLPPPNSLWYSTTLSPYGPRISGIKVGDIQSVDKNSSEWNPCKHSTMRGDALYLGPGGLYAPYWRKPNPALRCSFTAAVGSGTLPKLLPTYLFGMNGRPCTAADPYLHARNGDLIRASLSSIDGRDRYYNLDTFLCANIGPPQFQSASTQAGYIPYAAGQWYARSVNGAICTSNDYNTYWFKTDWDRPTRTTFVRDTYSEYHTKDSYTPESPLAYTGYGYVREANHRLTTCNITHVRSVSAGQFQIRFDHTTELDWFGWKPWAPFKGSLSKTYVGLTAPLLILEPGLTPEISLPLEKANSYCANAKKRAHLLYDAKDATSARTAAVRDVQELDSNWIENLAGLKGTMACVKPLIDGYKAVKTGNLVAARNALAGGYLVYKYVVSPGIADAQNIKKDGARVFNLATTNRFSNERRRGATSREGVAVCGTKATCSYFTTYHLYLKSNYFSEIWSALEKLGLEPTASQIWDLIPFSFVADWFAPIGDSLRNVDAYNSLALNRQLRGRIESFKVQWPVEKQVLSDLFDGNICSNGKPVEYSWYDRRIHHTIGSVDAIAISNGNGLTTSQMAQGTALLSQMKMKR